MTYSMASIIKKTLRGKAYYYARECRRVNGRPTIVWQKYLGKADDIVAALARPAAAPTPEKAVLTEFGAVVALFKAGRRCVWSAWRFWSAPTSMCRCATTPTPATRWTPPPWPG